MTTEEVLNKAQMKVNLRDLYNHIQRLYDQIYAINEDLGFVVEIRTLAAIVDEVNETAKELGRLLK